MHPLRVLLFVSLGIAAAVAFAFAELLFRAGVARFEAVALAVAVFGAFLLPWSGVFYWAIRRASDLDLLIDRTLAIVAHGSESIHDREYHGELDDLARAIDELRIAMEREKAWSAERRATMEQIAASLREGLLAIGARGRIVLANRRIGEIFGIEGSVVGKPLLETLRHESLLSAFDRALEGMASTDRIAIGPRQIEVRVEPVASSTEVAAVALFIDVTQLEQLQRMRKEFLDDFSHEVRTPLAGVRSAVESFDARDLRPEEEEQLRQVMRRQLARIERLVQNLSELNRIESGELILERGETDLHALLDELCTEFRGRLRGETIRFTLRGGKTLASVDPSRAQQIFSNLIDNAWKHGGSQGEVLIEVGEERGAAFVRVSDQGEGIPPHEIDRVFNRFYRVDKSRSQTVPGVGLGLAIAKHLVLLHGGGIRAWNRPDGGATFEVLLPVSAGETVV